MMDSSDHGGRHGPGEPAPGARGTRARTARTKLAEVVVVCSKCAKRQGLRPRALRALLKRAARDTANGAASDATENAGRKGDPAFVEPRDGRRKLCVVASGCLGPCPKRAVAVATGASLAAGRVVLLDPGAGPREALAAVLGAGGAPRGLPAAAPWAPATS